MLLTTQIISQLFSVLRGTHNSPRVDRKYMLMLGFSSGINVIHCLPNMYRVMWPIEKDTLCTPVCAMTATTEPPGKLLFSTNVNKSRESKYIDRTIEGQYLVDEGMSFILRCILPLNFLDELTCLFSGICG